MKSKTIKLETLIKLNACQNQVDLFKETFGESVELSEAIAKEFGSKFDINWAANNLLNEEQLNAYQEAKAPFLKTYEEATAPLLKTYQEAKAPLWKAYEEARAPLLKAYQEANAPLWKAYQEAKAPLWKAYEEARAPIWKTYKEALTVEFAKIYIG